MTPLAVVLGCPGRDWLDALALVGFVALVLVVGVGLIWFWEKWQDHLREMMNDDRA